MLAKRLSVIVLSAVAGFVITTLVLFAIRTLVSTLTLERYGYGYFVVTAMLIGTAFFVWADHIMKTEILPR